MDWTEWIIIQILFEISSFRFTEVFYNLHFCLPFDISMIDFH